MNINPTTNTNAAMLLTRNRSLLTLTISYTNPILLARKKCWPGYTLYENYQPNNDIYKENQHNTVYVKNKRNIMLFHL